MIGKGRDERAKVKLASVGNREPRCFMTHLNDCVTLRFSQYLSFLSFSFNGAHHNILPSLPNFFLRRHPLVDRQLLWPVRFALKCYEMFVFKLRITRLPSLAI